jgi:hypothetical protein
MIVFQKSLKINTKKNNAWNEVAEAAKMPVEDCIKRYKNIRTNYVRNCKKMKPSGSGRTSNGGDNPYHSFRWLDTFIEHRPTATNVPSRSLSPLQSNTSSISDTESWLSGSELQENNDEDDNGGEPGDDSVTILESASSVVIT